MGPAPSVLLWTAVRIYRDGLVDALARDARIARVDAVVDASACREAVLDRRPSVVVIDACSPGALRVAAELRATRVGVVALGITECDADVVAFAEAGVAAYLTHDQTLEHLVNAVLAVGRGEAHCSPRVTAMVLRHVASLAVRHEASADLGGRRAAVATAPPPTATLTRREAQVLRLLGDGLTNKQIALRLSIELATVKNHVHHILEKLGARSRAQAVAMGRD